MVISCIKGNCIDALGETPTHQMKEHCNARKGKYKDARNDKMNLLIIEKGRVIKDVIAETVGSKSKSGS